jgi:hypothetical protein
MQWLLVSYVLGLLVASFVAWRRGWAALGVIPRFWVRSAKWLLVEAEGLAASRAQWEEILEVLNPGADPRMHDLLLELREPHMFAPRAGLEAIGQGCRISLRANAGADAFTALNAAKRSMEVIAEFAK